MTSIYDYISHPTLDIKNKHISEIIGGYLEKRNYEGVISVLRIVYDTEQEPLLQFLRWREKAAKLALDKEVSGIDELFSTEDFVNIQKLNFQAEKHRFDTVLKYIDPNDHALAVKNIRKVVALRGLCRKSADAAISLHYYVISCLQSRPSKESEISQLPIRSMESATELVVSDSNSSYENQIPRRDDTSSRKDRDLLNMKIHVNCQSNRNNHLNPSHREVIIKQDGNDRERSSRKATSIQDTEAPLSPIWLPSHRVGPFEQARAKAQTRFHESTEESDFDELSRNSPIPVHLPRRNIRNEIVDTKRERCFEKNCADLPRQAPMPPDSAPPGKGFSCPMPPTSKSLTFWAKTKAKPKVKLRSDSENCRSASISPTSDSEHFTHKSSKLKRYEARAEDEAELSDDSHIDTDVINCSAPLSEMARLAIDEQAPLAHSSPKSERRKLLNRIDSGSEPEPPSFEHRKKSSKVKSEKELAEEVSCRVPIYYTSAIKWTIGKQRSALLKLERDFEVSIIIVEDTGFVIRGRKVNVYECIYEIWSQISKRFQKELKIKTYTTEINLDFFEVVNIAVQHAVFIERVSTGWRCFSFNSSNFCRISELLETSGSTVSGSDEDEQNFSFRLSHVNVRGWLHGKDRCHLNHLEKKFKVLITPLIGGRYNVCGTRRNALHCVYTIWKTFSAPHCRRERFENILEWSLSQDQYKAVRTWRDVDIAEFTLQHSVYVDLERKLLVALDRVDLDKALTIIERGEFHGSQEKKPFPQDFSVTFQIASKAIMGFIYGKCRTRLTAFENHHGVSIAVDRENHVTVCGDRNDVFECVLHIWSSQLSHMKSQLLPLEAKNLTWDKEKLVEFISKYSAFVDPKLGTIMAINQEHLNAAVVAIQSRERS